MNRKQRELLVFFGPLIITLIAVLGLPLIIAFRQSFLGDGINTGFVGLSNYKEVLLDPILGKVLRNTLLFVGFSVLLHFTIGLGLAMLLNLEMRGRKIFRILLLLPWLIPPVVGTLGWSWVLSKEWGILNAIIFHQLQVVSSPLPWLTSPGLAMLSIIMVFGWRGYGFVMVMLLAGLQGIPVEQYEALAIDGGSGIDAFFHITLPNLRFILMVTLFLDMVWTFQHFDIIKVLTDGGPVNSTEMFSTLIYRVAFRFFEFGHATAIAILLFLGLSILGVIYVRIVLRGTE